MMRLEFLCSLVLVVCLNGCAGTQRELALPDASLRDSSGASHRLRPQPPDNLTVLIFYSPHCPMLRAHDERLRKLATTYESRAVAFFALYSEVDDAALTRAESARYPFPILRDDEATLARQFGAQYSGYTLVVGPRGDVLYRGGIDSDRIELHADATEYLKEALDDLLAGRAPRNPDAKSYGCVLRLR